VLEKIRSSKASKPLIALLVLGAIVMFGCLTGRATAAQPHMQAALDHLKAAKAELDAADPDKGGHRAAAIRLVNDAIVQVEKGIRFAAQH